MSNFQREHLWQVGFAIACALALAVAHFYPVYATPAHIAVGVIGGVLFNLGLLSESAVQAAAKPSPFTPEVIKQVIEAIKPPAPPPV